MASIDRCLIVLNLNLLVAYYYTCMTLYMTLYRYSTVLVQCHDIVQALVLAYDVMYNVMHMYNICHVYDIVHNDIMS